MRNAHILFLRLKKALWIRPASPLQRRVMRAQRARVPATGEALPLAASPAIAFERRQVGM